MKAGAMADSGPGPQGPLELSDVEQRRSFTCLAEEDVEALAELRPVFMAHADEVIDRFYEHLHRTPALQSYLAEPATVARVKEAQRRYLMSLTEGRFDGEYAESRLRIGHVHERIGLDPQWYLGTCGLYIDLLAPVIEKAYPDDPARANRACGALTKHLILDMQMVLDAYHGTREVKAQRRQEQLAAVGELAASIAHEVRNPLAGMKGALEILRSELAVKPSNLEVVDELLNQIRRLEALVRDLLTYARPHVIHPQEFDLHELLDRLLKQYNDRADAAGITVHRIYGPGTGQLRADPQQMEQVLLNLMHNAFQAMEEGGILTVATQATKAGILVSFRDTGKGIPPDQLSRVFQPFYTTKHRGSGLGLPIVKKIVEAHGGLIEVSSAPGRGTTASLTFPMEPEWPKNES